VGGASISLNTHPYQVALVRAGQAAAADDGQYCGGSIRDERHVITAAHCVFDTPGSPSGQPLSPAQVEVLAGTEDLRSEGPPAQRLHVSRISYDPSFNGDLQYDGALLTLASALQFDGKVQPLGLVDDADWAAITPGAPLFVTGWGATQDGGGPVFSLRGVQVPLVDDATCEDDYVNDTPPFPYDGSVQICAAKTTPPGGQDACKGDSGGPLVRASGPATRAGDELVGIVSQGIGCGRPDKPGIYTEVAAPSIRAFLTLLDPPPAPANRSAPSLNGVAAVGEQLSCAPGDWTGSPSFSYQYVRSTATGDVDVAASGPQPTYAVVAADAGTALRCVVTATNAGGASVAETTRTGVVAGPPLSQSASPTNSNNQDSHAPVARVTKASCTATRCVLAVAVSHAGFSAGIKTVQASVRSTYRGACKVGGKRVVCTRHKTRRPRVAALGGARFQVVAAKLPTGTQVFTLVAVDSAGHRQALPTRKTVTTKKPRTRR
jgi:trypsin